jgi:hypothetical protein
MSMFDANQVRYNRLAVRGVRYGVYIGVAFWVGIGVLAWVMLQ